MVSRLRRPKSKLDIQLFGGPSFHPGDTVKGRIDLNAQESFYVREGRIQLICDHVAHDYENREYRSSESGGYANNRTLNRLVYLSEPFLTDTQVFPGADLHKDISCSLPDNVPPTMDNVSWYVDVRLDIAKARDIRQQVGMVMLSWKRPSLYIGDINDLEEEQKEQETPYQQYRREEEERNRLDNLEPTSDVKKRVGLGALGALIGALIGALTGPSANVCWSIFIIGDCFERGSIAALIGATLIAATIGGFLVPSIFLPQRKKTVQKKQAGVLDWLFKERY